MKNMLFHFTGVLIVIPIVFMIKFAPSIPSIEQTENIYLFVLVFASILLQTINLLLFRRQFLINIYQLNPKRFEKILGAILVTLLLYFLVFIGTLVQFVILPKILHDIILFALLTLILVLLFLKTKADIERK